MFYICTYFLEKKEFMNILKRLSVAIFLLISLGISAQKHEIGVQAGMANLVGDIGRTNYILQKPFRDVKTYGLPAYIGVMYKLNFNPYQGIRFNVGYANLQFRDISAKEYYRYNRNLEGTNSVYNLDAQFEYNFLPINNEQRGMLSPYIFGGLGGIMYSKRQVTLDLTGSLLLDAAGNLIPPMYSTAVSTLNKSFALSTPFGIGLKYKFNYNWAAFGELKFRYTFTDGLDYSSLSDKDVKIVGKATSSDGSQRNLTSAEKQSIIAPYIAGQQIGNTNSNDWVNTVTIGLSYSFGRPPCNCD